MIPQPGARTVSVSDAAKAVGVTRRTIYAWMDRGLLAYTYTAGGSRRILWDSLWRESGGIGAGSQPVTGDTGDL